MLTSPDLSASLDILRVSMTVVLYVAGRLKGCRHALIKTPSLLSGANATWGPSHYEIWEYC